MNKEIKPYLKIYIAWFPILIVLFISGSIAMIYLSKDTPIPILFICFYILLGMFSCIKNVKLLTDIRKILSSKDTLADSTLSELKNEHKTEILSFVVYIISLPCSIAVILYLKYSSM